MLPQVRIAIPSSAGHCRNMIRGVYRYAHLQTDWRLTHSEGGRLPERIDPSKIQGILALGREKQIRSWAESGLPLVNLSNSDRVPGVVTVDTDDREAGRRAAKYFLARGFRHFAYAALRSHYSREREVGFREALRAVGADCVTHHPWEGRRDLSTGSGRTYQEVATEWLKALPKPVAVLACSDAASLLLLELSLQAGLLIPDEVALLGVDNDDLVCTIRTPTLSSVALRGAEIGYRAAEILHDLMRGRPAASTVTLVPPGEVVTRQSTERAPVEDLLVRQAVAFIHENAHLPLAVGDVVERVPVNRRALEKRFRSCLGRTILDEIRRAHLERACLLLRESDLSLGEVARRSGFRSAARFSTAFGQALGKTPKMYRRQEG